MLIIGSFNSIYGWQCVPLACGKLGSNVSSSGPVSLTAQNNIVLRSSILFVYLKWDDTGSVKCWEMFCDVLQVQRVALAGDGVDIATSISGTVVAIYGQQPADDCTGRFFAKGVVFPSLPKQIPRPVVPQDKWVTDGDASCCDFEFFARFSRKIQISIFYFFFQFFIFFLFNSTTSLQVRQNPVLDLDTKEINFVISRG